MLVSRAKWLKAACTLQLSNRIPISQNKKITVAAKKAADIEMRRALTANAIGFVSMDAAPAFKFKIYPCNIGIQ